MMKMSADANNKSKPLHHIDKRVTGNEPIQPLPASILVEVIERRLHLSIPNSSSRVGSAHI